MKQLTLFLLLLVMLLTGCAPAMRGEASVDESYAVYAALIRQKFLAEGIQTFVIMNQTATDMGFAEGQLAWLKDSLPGIDQAIIEAFMKANAKPAALEDQFGLEQKVVLFSQEDMAKYFSEMTPGWDGFYVDYPNSPGIITLSQVGFNAAGDRALVYVGNQAGWLAGGGYYVQLVKQDGAWQVENEIMTWIS